MNSLIMIKINDPILHEFIDYTKHIAITHLILFYAEQLSLIRMKKVTITIHVIYSDSLDN